MDRDLDEGPRHDLDMIGVPALGSRRRDLEQQVAGG